MRLIVTGGGTGGHIYPAIAIAQGIKEKVPETEILYVGTARGMESTIVPRLGYAFKSVDISGLDRSSLLKASQSMMKFPKSFIQAREIVKKFRPDVVLGTGGYVSFPVVYASTFFPCKTIIHEQNATPGLANRHLAKRVDYTLLTFEEAQSLLQAKRVVVTGLPVRQEILQVDRENARQKMGVGDAFTLVAFGGSRGAMSINRAMLEVVERYQGADLQIIWITGDVGFNEIEQELAKRVKPDIIADKVKLVPYMYDIEQALAAADLAVCRAGASTLSELAILKLPAILVPYPYAAENHQEKNARALVNKNAAQMVIDEFLDGDTLFKTIENLRQNSGKLEQMRINLAQQARPDALNQIVKTIIGE